MAEIHRAAKNNDVETLRRLLAEGVDVNSPDLGGYTPLMIAAKNSSVEAAQLLFEQSADLFAKNRWDTTAIEYATLAECAPILKMFLDRGVVVAGNPLGPRLLGYSQGSPNMAAMLLQAGATPAVLLTNAEWHTIFERLGNGETVPCPVCRAALISHRTSSGKLNDVHCPNGCLAPHLLLNAG